MFLRMLNRDASFFCGGRRGGWGVKGVEFGIWGLEFTACGI